MAKPIDKMTKAELIALLQHVQTTATKFDAQLVQRTSDVRRLMAENEQLREQITRLESRRNYERVAYQSKLREQQAVSPRRAAMEAAKAEAMRTGRCVAVQA